MTEPRGLEARRKAARDGEDRDSSKRMKATEFRAWLSPIKTGYRVTVTSLRDGLTKTRRVEGTWERAEEAAQEMAHSLGMAADETL